MIDVTIYAFDVLISLLLFQMGFSDSVLTANSEMPCEWDMPFLRSGMNSLKGSLID